MNFIRIIDGRMKIKPTAKKAGFTLIEIMISAFIFTIIFSALYVVLNVGRNSWQTGSADIAAQSAARRGMRIMSRELRQTTVSDSGYEVSITGSSGGPNRITFYLPDYVSGGSINWLSNTVTYELDSDDGDDDNGDRVTDQVIRTFNSVPKVVTVVANDVTNLIFTNPVDGQVNLLEIEMQIQTQTPAGGLRNVTTKTQVMFRN